MATNVTAAAAHIAYDMQPPESLHRTKYQIKAKKNQDLEHTELEMLITMNVHIPLPNPNLSIVQLVSGIWILFVILKYILIHHIAYPLPRFISDLFPGAS